LAKKKAQEAIEQQNLIKEREKQALIDEKNDFTIKRT